MKEDTRNKIQKAFFDLLEEKSFQAISINDVSKQAGIARQTFYTYFQSKDELLLSFMDEIFFNYLEEMDAYLEESSSGDPHEMMVQMFQTWLDNYAVLIHVINADIDGLVYKRFRNYIARVAGRMIQKLGLKGVKDTEFLEYSIDALAGAVFHSLIRWMKNETPYTPEEMAFIVGLTGKNLKFKIEDSNDVKLSKVK